jgi:hypothetical protein
LNELTTLDELDKGYAKKLSELSLKKEKICGNRPGTLVALKIKEQYITSMNSCYLTDFKGNKEKKNLDLAQSNTLSHYEFIL